MQTYFTIFKMEGPPCKEITQLCKFACGAAFSNPWPRGGEAEVGQLNARTSKHQLCVRAPERYGRNKCNSRFRLWGMRGAHKHLQML